jgi:PAP2 superfamily
MFVLGGTAQIVLVTVVMTPLTYIATATNFPLQDTNLLAIDRALGFDWTGYVQFVNDHPLLAGWLSYGYTMIRWPIFAIPVVLAAAHRYRRLQEFTFAFAVALAATTIISAFVPAKGIYFELPDISARFSHIAPVAYLESVSELPLVRDGSLRHLELLGLTGLVTFPSFHAASAALYTWALWPVRWIRPLAVVANGVMLLSCPVDGAHYVIDLVAGVAIALLAIVAAGRVGEWVARRQANDVAAAAIPGAAAPAE